MLVTDLNIGRNSGDIEDGHLLENVILKRESTHSGLPYLAVILLNLLEKQI